MKTKLLYLLLMYSCFLFAQAPWVGDPLYGSFRPEPGQKYIVSCWAKEDHAQQQKTYSNAHIEVSFLLDVTPFGAVFPFYPSGNVIDGWQRIVGIVEIPTFESIPVGVKPAIKIKLVNASEENIDAYFDDVRFFPYNGSLKSFVYDEQTQKLLAELDENNYATFYEYDLEGGLIRIKKETEKGIYTIQESRSATSNAQP